MMPMRRELTWNDIERLYPAATVQWDVQGLADEIRSIEEAFVNALDTVSVLMRRNDGRWQFAVWCGGETCKWVLEPPFGEATAFVRKVLGLEESAPGEYHKR